MLLQDLVLQSAARSPDKTALIEHGSAISYAELATRIRAFAAFIQTIGLQPGERVGVYLNKQVAAVVAFFGAACAGCTFVPINPRLKPAQVSHILSDCEIRLLVTNSALANALDGTLADCTALSGVVVSDGWESTEKPRVAWHDWSAVMASPARAPNPHIIDADVAAVFYTSGSTGLPKGVVLSHRNIVAGAHSVASYLDNVADDVILAVLPLSFDAGFSQLTSAFAVGASVVLIDYLLPQDVINAVADHAVTGLAGVPTLWNQLAGLEWASGATRSLRYLTNTGGAMPVATLQALRRKLPQAAPYLMYGLTEAFRSTYLPPSELDRRPTSIGVPIPNADVAVVRPDGTECGPGEHGELVHRGALVAQGYWNDAAATAKRFKPWPLGPAERKIPEPAVWSGDTVYRDDDGFFYFVGRADEMIKSSGYRISPSEVEDCLQRSDYVAQCAAFGVPHDELGQAVVAVYSPDAALESADELMAVCRRELPGYMVPRKIIGVAELPTTPTGKIDRRHLRAQYLHLFTGAS
ncbi:MAG: acyl-CoA ligase (AMP-forming), exosortase A system-associated [Pseudomonadota bacterium]